MPLTKAVMVCPSKIPSSSIDRNLSIKHCIFTWLIRICLVSLLLHLLFCPHLPCLLLPEAIKPF